MPEPALLPENCSNSPEFLAIRKNVAPPEVCAPAARAETFAVRQERRGHARKVLTSLLYAELEHGTGGIVNNLSESGMELRLAIPIFQRELPAVRFRLTDSEKPITTAARVVWLREGNRLAGLEFSLPSAELRGQIAAYLKLAAALEGIEIPGSRMEVERAAARPMSLAAEVLDAVNGRSEARAAGMITEGKDKETMSEGKKTEADLEAKAVAEAASASAGSVEAPATVTDAQDVPIDAARAELHELQAAVMVESVERKIFVEQPHSVFGKVGEPAIFRGKPKEPSRAAAKPVWDHLLSISLGVFLIFVGWAVRGVYEEFWGQPSAAANPVVGAPILPPTNAANGNEVVVDGFRIAPEVHAQKASAIVPPVRVNPQGARAASAPAATSIPRNLVTQRVVSAVRIANGDDDSSAKAATGVSHAAAAAAIPAAPANLEKREPMGLVQNGQMTYRADADGIAKSVNAVKVRAVIGPDGRVRSALAESGAAGIVPAALGAVRGWRFEVMRANGVPVASMCDVTVEVVER